MAETILLDARSELGSAVLVGKHENQSPEWHALRKTGIGGSDVGTICGLNPWQSPFSLFCRKTGRLPEQESNDAMEWGTRLEDVIMDKFEESHPELTITRSPGTYAHKDRPWQLANPDGVYVADHGASGIIEIKTARYEDSWLSGVPEYYKTQVQWYLQTFGFRHAYVAVLFGGSTYREYYVPADDWQQEANLAKVIEFKHYLDNDIEPDYDGSDSTYQSVRQLHPLIDDAEIELGPLGVAYVEALAAQSSVESVVTELKSRIMAEMGTAKRGLINGKHVLSREAKGGGAPYLVKKRSK